MKLEVYRATPVSNNVWRWRLVARNGRIIADSGEAYTRKWRGIQAAKKFMACKPHTAKLVVNDDAN